MSMYPIASYTVTNPAGVANFDFLNIPQIYDHLHLRAFVRGNFTFADGLSLYLQPVWGTAATAVNRFQFRTNGTSSATGRDASFGLASVVADTNANASGSFSGIVCDFLDYTNTSKSPTVRGFGGFDRNGGGVVSLGSTTYIDAQNMTQLTISSDGALVQNSRFDLYGVFGSVK